MTLKIVAMAKKMLRYLSTTVYYLLRVLCLRFETNKKITLIKPFFGLNWQPGRLSNGFVMAILYFAISLYFPISCWRLMYVFIFLVKLR